KDRSSEGFQVFLYSYVYMKKYPSVVPLPVIYSVRQDITDLNTRFSMSENKIRTEVNTSNIKELTDKFALNLQSVLARLFDKNQTFEASPGDNCKYCDFKSFCGK
ncbi:MAG: PD-(D/E)XK nuclease family protein, partial [Alphaproteobacteria bacterium]